MKKKSDRYTARYKGDKEAERKKRKRAPLPMRPPIKELKRSENGLPHCPTHGEVHVHINGDTWHCGKCGIDLGKVPKSQQEKARRNNRVVQKASK